MSILPNLKDLIEWKVSEFRGNSFNTTVNFWYTYYKEEGAITIPEYQRDYVWTKEQRENLIRSLFFWISVPPLILNRNPEETDRTIVDWWQRYRTLCLFFDNELEVDWIKFEDLSQTDRRRFLNKVLPYIETSFKNIQEEKEFYKLLNTSGTAHTQEDIKKAE